MLGIVCTSILQRNKKIDYDASRERAIESVQFQRAVLFCSSRSHLGELLVVLPGLGRWSGDPPHPRREARQRGALCCVRSRMKNTEQYVIISFDFHKCWKFRQWSDMFLQIWLKSRQTTFSFLGFGAKSGKIVYQEVGVKMQMSRKRDERNRKLKYSIAKKCWRCFAEILRFKNGAKECSV